MNKKEKINFPIVTSMWPDVGAAAVRNNQILLYI